MSALLSIAEEFDRDQSAAERKNHGSDAQFLELAVEVGFCNHFLTKRFCRHSERLGKSRLLQDDVSYVAVGDVGRDWKIPVFDRAEPYFVATASLSHENASCCRQNRDKIAIECPRHYSECLCDRFLAHAKTKTHRVLGFPDAVQDGHFRGDLPHAVNKGVVGRRLRGDWKLVVNANPYVVIRAVADCDLESRIGFVEAVFHMVEEIPISIAEGVHGRSVHFNKPDKQRFDPKGAFAQGSTINIRKIADGGSHLYGVVDVDERLINAVNLSPAHVLSGVKHLRGHVQHALLHGVIKADHAIARGAGELSIEQERLVEILKPNKADGKISKKGGIDTHNGPLPKIWALNLAKRSRRVQPLTMRPHARNVCIGADHSDLGYSGAPHPLVGGFFASPIRGRDAHVQGFGPKASRLYLRCSPRKAVTPGVARHLTNGQAPATRMELQP